MKEAAIREHLVKGWIRAIVTFEVVGKPAKHIEQSLEDYIANIKQDHRIIVLQDEREPAIEHDDGLFSTFCELEAIFQDLETFTWLCINFSPASIEIIEPDEYRVGAREITNWLNDLLAKLHEVGQSYRLSKAGNENLTLAMNQLIKNAILLCLKTGTKTEPDLESETGIAKEQLDPFLKHLLSKDLIVDKKNGYALK